MRFVALLGLACSAFAYSPDYFPLQVGNQWIYRATFAGSTSQVNVSVTGTEDHAGKSYAVVEGLDEGRTLFRQDDSGTLWTLDAAGRENPWAVFSTPDGGEYATSINPCTTRARVKSRDAMVNTPAGNYPGALQIEYPAGGCADAGLTGDWFLPWIGLVRRESTTIAGPRILELLYSRTGGVTVLSQPEASFGVSLNTSSIQLVKGVTPQIEARLTLRVTATPVVLDFNSGQHFNFAIRNETGDTVYLWSLGKFFTSVVSKETVGPGERHWPITLNAADNGGQLLAPGRYTLEGWLTTAGPKRYAATVGFEVLAPR